MHVYNVKSLTFAGRQRNLVLRAGEKLAGLGSLQNALEGLIISYGGDPERKLLTMYRIDGVYAPIELALSVDPEEVLYTGVVVLYTYGGGRVYETLTPHTVILDRGAQGITAKLIFDDEHEELYRIA